MKRADSTSRARVDLVIRLLRGETLETVANEGNVLPRDLERWREFFERGLRTTEDIEEEIRSKVGEVLRTVPAEGSQGRLDRLRRALSWVVAAERYRVDIDIAFICHWIAVNSLFGGLSGRPPDEGSERRRYRLPNGEEVEDDISAFIKRFLRLDRSRVILGAVRSLSWQETLAPLVGDKWTFGPYWKEGLSSNVETRLSKRKRAARDALRTENLEVLLHILLMRTQDLRNQIVHGAASYYVSQNRESIRPALAVLAALVPAFITVIKSSQAAAERWPRPPRPPRATPLNRDVVP